MRPVELVMEGFSGFRQRAEVNFRDVDLAAFVGPTGAGKSSIIDGITFALYGSIPRYSDDRLVAPVIHQVCAEAKVRLTFEVAEATYTAVRVVRRTKGGATTREARLERGDEVLAGNAREMTQAVEELLGLSFEQFTKTVVLPQGRFADFLHDKPRDRQALLRKLLDLEVYARMAAMANHQARTLGERAAARAEELERLAGLDADGLAERQQRADALATALDAARVLAERHRELGGRLQEARGALVTRDEQLAALAEVRQPADVQGLDARLRDARAQAEQGSVAADAAAEAFDLAQQAAADGPDVAACHELLAAHQQVERISAQLPAFDERLTAAQARAGAATATLASARQVLEAAQDQLDHAKEAAGLGAVVAQLRVGEPCPVCRQQVHELPDHDTDAELDAARQAHTAARRRATEAEREDGAAGMEQAKAETEVSVRRQELERLQALVAAAPGPQELQRQLDRAQDLATALDQAGERLRAANRAREDAQVGVDALGKEERAARRALGTARDRVVALGPPEPSGDRLLDDWKALVTWTEATGETVRSARDADAATVQELEAGHAQVQVDADELCRPIGVDPSLDGLTERLATAAERTRGQAERYRDDLVRRDDVAREVEGLHEQRLVAEQLGNLLNAKNFERWLLAEALVDLGERASERLRELSGGQYSLEAQEDAFSVRDHRNGDELRDVRTLSGGETFLASLALALALADGIRDLASTDSPRLESVFLDEGFGTLDPEALDVVAAAIEDLGATGRMVGIVTHLRELAERMPVRFEVHRDSDGSHVERRDL